jgi:prepilin-type processing-associated H-X9-DG protein
MALQTKYEELIRTARTSGVSDLQVREQNNVLYIDGHAPSENVKQQRGFMEGDL